MSSIPCLVSSFSNCYFPFLIPTVLETLRLRYYPQKNTAMVVYYNHTSSSASAKAVRDDGLQWTGFRPLYIYPFITI
jgi:hypothetical protein